MTLRVKFLASVVLIAVAATTFACFVYGSARNAKISFVLTELRARNHITVAVDLRGQTRRLREPLASAEIYVWSRSGIAAYGSDKTGLFIRAPGHPARRIVSANSDTWRLDARVVA